MADWPKAKAQASKILGGDADIPDLPDAVMKASKAFNDASTTFKASREEIEGKLLEMDNANAGLLNAVEQFRAKIEKNDLGLDPKKDAKKIQQARAVLLADIASAVADLKRNDKTLDELNKHLIQLGKYKQGSGSY